MEKEARREVGRDERSRIICRKEIFDRKPYIMPNRIMVKCELRDVMLTFAVIKVNSHFSALSKLDARFHGRKNKPTLQVLPVEARFCQPS
jgi:hypothetical protein